MAASLYLTLSTLKKTVPTKRRNNYCSDHDSDPGGAWCYTISDKVRWEYCDVLYECDSLPDARDLAAARNEIMLDNLDLLMEVLSSQP